MTRGRLCEVTLDQLKWMTPLLPEDIEAARLSRPLMAGFYGEELVCILGFVPATILSDTAYLWLITKNDILVRHRVSFGRSSVKFMKNILASTPYDIVWGYCFDPRGRRWLEWLGATFSGTRFEFRRI